MTTYTYGEVRDASVTYFRGDELAADVFAGKYALQDLKGNIYELTPPDMHRRLAREFARIEANYPNPLSEDEVYAYLTQWEIVAQGGPMSAIGNPYQVQSLSNCFVIQSPHDSYGGIMRTDEEQVQIMKRRGGVGFDLSTIRPRGLPAANAARTTDGIGVFMERYSNTCREVAQGGRRGALMLTIDVRHPEVLTFANIKRDTRKVTGANVSIRVTDGFMRAVVDGETYAQRFPIDAPPGECLVEQHVDARTVWLDAVKAMRDCSEPGFLFWDTVRRMTPTEAYADVGFGSVSTNPCIVGSTLIAVADGRNAVTVKQLADEGKDVPVYSTNVETGQVEIKWARNPRMTKSAVEVWKLTLDDGSHLIATPDHGVLKRDRTYVELRSLKPGDSVFPFSTFNSNGYRQVCETGVKMIGGARRNRRQYRLISEFLRGPVDPKVYAVHHADFDSTNDVIDNLVVMTHEEHRDLHARLMMGDLNPYHRMNDEWKQAFAKHPGTSNGRYSGHTNEQLLTEGRKLFEQNGRITTGMWVSHAKQHGLPQFLSNEFRFGTWQNFVNQVSTNHKVVSVERVGVEDVYNLTVDDNHNYHVITSHEDGRYVVSSGLCVKNCGEIVLSAYDSCRLILMNLWRFVRDPFTPGATFDFTAYSKATYVGQKLMDDLIDLELEAIDRILTKIDADPEPTDVKRVERELWAKIRAAAVSGRRTGLGVTALGDAIAGLGMRYGDEASVAFTDAVYRCHALASYRASVDMARDRGAFPAFSHDKERGHPFIERVMAEDSELRALYQLHGRRNIANTTTAPAGSVSILTQTSSGCEPVLFLKSRRKRKITAADKQARVDEVDELGDRWQHYDLFHPGLAEWMRVTGETDVALSPYHGATVEEIDPLRKIDVQAAAQRWIDHSISNTTNLPADVTVETVAALCTHAWETGCKGVTVYRKGSRAAVIVDETASKEGGQPLVVVETHAPKRPKDLPCDIHRVAVKGEQYTVIVGLMGDRPYEVFAGLSEHVEVPKKAKKGTLAKNGKKDGVATYNLSIPVGDDDSIVVKDVVSMFDNPEHGALTRVISMSLRHGVPMQYVVEQLKKDRRSDLQSFSGVIARVLKGYIPDGVAPTAEKSCPLCGGSTLVYQSGCVQCVGGTMPDGTTCTWSKC